MALGSGRFLDCYPDRRCAEEAIGALFMPTDATPNKSPALRKLGGAV